MPSALQNIKAVVSHPIIIRILSVVAAFAIGIPLCFILPPTPTGDRAPAFVLGITVIMALLWVTNQVPSAITALIPVFLFPIFGVASGNDVSSAYVNSVTMIFIGGFMLSLAMERWGVDRRIALIIILKTLKSKKGTTNINRLPLILFGFSFTSYALSFWLSNTATALIMLPNALAMIHRLEKLFPNPPERAHEQNLVITPFSKSLFLSIAYGCNIGGIATLVGTPPNLIFVRQIEKDFKRTVSFFEWSLFATPVSLVFMIFLFGFFYIFFVRTTMRKIREHIKKFEEMPSSADEQQAPSTPALASAAATEMDTISESIAMPTPTSGDQQPLNESVTYGLMQDEAERTGDMVNTGGKGLALDLSEFEAEYKAMGKISFEEFMVCFLFLIVIILWTTRFIGIGPITGWEVLFKKGFMTDGTVAVLFAFILFIIPARNIPYNERGRQRPGVKKYYNLMDWDSTLHKFPWDILLLFGGGFALSDAFKTSGLSGIIANQLKFFQTLHPFVIILIICTIVTFCTEVTSNIATIQIFLPILTSLSIATKIDPISLMIPATASCSYAFMLPVATAPNALSHSYSEDRVRVKDMAITGLVLNLFGIAITSVTSYFVLPLIFGQTAIPSA